MNGTHDLLVTSWLNSSHATSSAFHCGERKSQTVVDVDSFCQVWFCFEFFSEEGNKIIRAGLKICGGSQHQHQHQHQHRHQDQHQHQHQLLEQL